MQPKVKPHPPARKGKGPSKPKEHGAFKAKSGKSAQHAEGGVQPGRFSKVKGRGHDMPMKPSSKKSKLGGHKGY